MNVERNSLKWRVTIRAKIVDHCSRLKYASIELSNANINFPETNIICLNRANEIVEIEFDVTCNRPKGRRIPR